MILLAEETATATSTLVLVALAVIGSFTTIVVALINGRRQRNDATIASVDRSVMQDSLDTGNDHSLGEAVARLEARASQNANRLDGIDVILRELRDSTAVAQQVLHVHLIDSEHDSKALKQLQDEWDAAKARVLFPTKGPDDAR